MNRTIQSVMDRRLSGLDFDEGMLRRLTLRVSQSEARVVRGRRGGQTILIAALTLVLLAAGALAAAIFSGSVDWFGDPVQTEIVEPTPRPDSEDVVRALEARMADLASEKPDDEIWYFRYADGKGEMSPAEESVTTYGDLEKLLKEPASPLELPEIPDGYQFVGGSLQFYYTEENLKSLIALEEETPAEGVTLKKFQAGDALKACISGYDAQFQNGEGKRLSVWANLDFASTDWSFSVNEGDAYETVSVAGMKNALYIGDEGEGTLHLLKSGIAPIWVLDTFAPISARDLQDDAEVYDSIVYMIHTDDLGKDALVAMAESLA